MNCSICDEIFKQSGLQSIYGVNIVELIEFGKSQKYNVLFGQFAAGGATKVDGTNGSATWTDAASKEICVGVDNTRGAFLRPVARQAESGGTFNVLPDAQWDGLGSRIERIGFYGSVEEGRVLLDARSLGAIAI